MFSIFLVANLFNSLETGLIQTSTPAVGEVYKISFKKTYLSPPLVLICNEQYVGNSPSANIQYFTIIRIQDITTTDFTIRIQKKDEQYYSPQFPYLVIGK